MKITKQKAQHSLKMFMSKSKRYSKYSPKAKYEDLKKSWLNNEIKQRPLD